MFGLGYERYASQGGDWGSPHARALGSKFQFEGGKGCRAVHLNFCPVGPPTSKLSYILPSWLLPGPDDDFKETLAFTSKSSMKHFHISLGLTLFEILSLRSHFKRIIQHTLRSNIRDLLSSLLL